jgi:ABC-type phosphate transport system substrate-binding protein
MEMYVNSGYYEIDLRNGHNGFRISFSWSQTGPKVKDMKMLKKNDTGVSPVIATLVLVLVAVAAGVAFFAWQSSWQDEATNNIGSGVTKTEIEIGGSSTVYPFTVVAAEAYMEANPTVQINYQSGGSGAGTAGVREGLIDIGAASSGRNQADDFPDHPDVVITQIGMDAVGIVVDSTNTRIDDINATVANEIFNKTITTWGQVPIASGARGYGVLDADGVTINGPTETIPDGYYRVWSNTTLARAVQVTAGALPASTLPAGDITETVWFQTILDGTDSADIHVYDRADKSGTEECFHEKLLGGDGSSMPDWGQTGVAGNQDMLDLFASHTDSDAIGFISTGVANSDVKLVTLDGVEATAENIAEGTYTASRPLLYMYVPSLCSNPAIVEDYVNFCMQTKNNQDFCSEVDYISYYKLV